MRCGRKGTTSSWASARDGRSGLGGYDDRAGGAGRNGLSSRLTAAEVTAMDARPLIAARRPGRPCVRRVSLGIYGDAVRRSSYRNAKLGTLLETIDEVLSATVPAPELAARGRPGTRGCDRQAYSARSRPRQMRRAAATEWCAVAAADSVTEETPATGEGARPPAAIAGMRSTGWRVMANSCVRARAPATRRVVGRHKRGL